MIKLRTFENFSQSPGDISDEELNSKIKEVVSNIVKTRQYFMMLHESAQNVYEMIEKVFPGNQEAFMDTLHDKDDLLAGIIGDILDIIGSSEAITEVDEIVAMLNNLHEYTDGNMDNILNGKGFSGEEIIDFESWPNDLDDDPRGAFDDDEDEDDWDVPPDLPVIEIEDQLKRRKKPIEAPEQEYSIKNNTLRKKKPVKVLPINMEPYQASASTKVDKPVIMSDLDKKIASFVKNKVKEDLKKGDIIYLKGLPEGTKLNGVKCKIVQKTEDKPNCYDIYNTTRPGSDDEPNIKGMPVEYMSREKVANTPARQVIKPAAKPAKKSIRKKPSK